jgi:hypothetical protein
MIELECPKCGRAGAIPQNKVNTRLVCKKCHIVFHMNTAGRTLLGEPPVSPSEKKKEKDKAFEAPALPSFEGLGDLRENIKDISPKKLAIAAGVLLVAMVGYTFLTAAPESLAIRASITAEKFAADDLAYLKNIASSGTADDVVRWFDAVHPKLVKSREGWKTTLADVQVQVIGEDRRQRVGEAQAFIYPGTKATHSESISSAAKEASEVSSTVNQSVDLHMFWTLDSSGKWRLDGRQTFQMANKAL